MIRRTLRLAVLAGIVAGVVAAVRALRSDEDPLPVPPTTPSEPWPPLSTATSAPAAAPASPAADPVVTAPEPDGVPVADRSFVEPGDDGECPAGFPIKAKMSSKIFHSPGQLNYDRTRPDRCYVDAAAAEADGLRAAKR